MRVLIPTPLRSYTSNRSEVDGQGATVGEVLASVEKRHRGFRFRIIDEQDRVRPTILIFVGGVPARKLDIPVAPGQDVHIICALSGGC